MTLDIHNLLRFLINGVSLTNHNAGYQSAFILSAGCWCEEGLRGSARGILRFLTLSSLLKKMGCHWADPCGQARLNSGET